MEYITNVHEKLTTINEDSIIYYDLFSDLSPYMYGTPFFDTYHSFNKYSDITHKEFESPSKWAQGDDNWFNSITNNFRRYSSNSSGCCLRFKTNSKKIILKVKSQQKYALMRMNMWGSSGFDIYIQINNNWKHLTICGPADGHDCWAEELVIPAKQPIMMYFPTYNVIQQMYIGATSSIQPIEDFSKPLPIAFYGQSVTQGCAASRSGNIFCNIVSRKMDIEVFNFSISGGCHGNISIAKQLGKLNLAALIIDYTRNSWNMKQFKSSYDNFYNTIRKYHPHIPIILMTTIILDKGNSQNNKYIQYDKHIYNVYNRAKSLGENTYVLDTMKTIGDNWEYIAVDHTHLNDGGMNIIANEIINILSQINI